MKNLFSGIPILIVILGLESSAWAQGCSMCRFALESSAEGKVLAASLAHGILLLLFLPYIIFGAVSFIVYRAYRKKSKRSAANYANTPIELA